MRLGCLVVHDEGKLTLINKLSLSRRTIFSCLFSEVSNRNDLVHVHMWLGQHNPLQMTDHIEFLSQIIEIPVDRRTEIRLNATEQIGRLIRIHIETKINLSNEWTL